MNEQCEAVFLSSGCQLSLPLFSGEEKKEGLRQWSDCTISQALFFSFLFMEVHLNHMASLCQGPCLFS